MFRNLKLLEVHNELAIALVAGTLIFFILISFSVGQVLLFKKKREQHFFEMKKMQMHYEQELLRTQLEIQEQTMKHIAQEIHDNVGQMLSLAKLNLNTIDFQKTEKAQEKVLDSKGILSKAIQDLRDLSRSLNTDAVAAAGLIRVIEQELQILQRTGTIQTNFNVIGKVIKLEQQKELILFRIVQEALHNIIKHANATCINVVIHYENDRIILRIADNGKGFKIQDECFDGSGLRNMESRSKLIGATFSIQSHIMNGTEILVQFPFVS